MRAWMPVGLGALVMVAVTKPLSACATCFGAPESALTEGMNSAILTLLGIVGVVWIGFGAAFVAFIVRVRRLRERKDRFRLIRGGAN